MSMPNTEDVVQYVIHPALRPRLDDWLREQGFRVTYFGPLPDDEPDLPTYIVVPGDELMRGARAAAAEVLGTMLPLYESINGDTCARCDHSGLQHLATRHPDASAGSDTVMVVTCSQCHCRTRLR